MLSNLLYINNDTHMSVALSPYPVQLKLSLLAWNQVKLLCLNKGTLSDLQSH